MLTAKKTLELVVLVLSTLATIAKVLENEAARYDC